MSKTNPTFFVDVHPEYQRGLDFRRVGELGYAAAIVKASQGGSYVPTGLREYFARAKGSGLIPGLYHFLDATAPGVVQAQHFARTIASVGGPEGKILAVDFEDYGDASPSNGHLSTFVAQLRRAIGDHPIVLYTAKSFWEGGDPSGPFTRYGCDALWSARYADMVKHDRPREHYGRIKDWGWDSVGGKTSDAWQFTSTGLVAGQYIDVNAFDGTRAELMALAKAGRAPEGPPPGRPTTPEPPMNKAQRAIAYMKKLIDPPTVYGWWRGGWPPPKNPPNPEWMFFPFGLPDPRTEVPDATCAGMVNLGNEAAGVHYRNGTLGYAKDLVNKRRYSPGVKVRVGEVLVNDNVTGPGAADLSHIVTYIGDGKVISCDHRFGGNRPGLNIHGLAESHRMFAYEFVGEVPGARLALMVGLPRSGKSTYAGGSSGSVGRGSSPTPSARRSTAARSSRPQSPSCGPRPSSPSGRCCWAGTPSSSTPRTRPAEGARGGSGSPATSGRRSRRS